MEQIGLRILDISELNEREKVLAPFVGFVLNRIRGTLYIQVYNAFWNQQTPSAKFVRCVFHGVRPRKFDICDKQIYIGTGLALSAC